MSLSLTNPSAFPNRSTNRQPILPAPAKVTFILDNAGETKAMQPVMNTLDRNGTPYNILADSTSTAAHLLTNNPHLIKVPTSPTSQDVSYQFIAPFLGQQLQSTQCVITGLVSNFQKNWTSFFKQNHRPVVGFYDGFDFNPANPSIQTFANSVDTFITPSNDTAQCLRQNLQINTPSQAQKPVLPLGNPVLEATTASIHNTNRSQLANTLGIDPSKPTVLFVGGYGPNYAQAFSLFCQTVKNLPNANFLVALHPNIAANGLLESQIIQQNQLQDKIKIIPKSIDTTQLLALSPVTLSQDSTFTIQAALQGKPVAYIGPAVNSNTYHPLLSHQLTKRYTDPNSIATFIGQAIQAQATKSALLSQPQPSQPNSAVQNQQNLYSLLGIPTGSTASIANYISRLLASQASPQHQVA